MKNIIKNNISMKSDLLVIDCVRGSAAQCVITMYMKHWELLPKHDYAWCCGKIKIYLLECVSSLNDQKVTSV